jgi:hypothetical protein
LRPTYETEDDLQRESEVIKKIESAWKCQAVKLSIKYSLDYGLKRADKVVAFCEIKTRNYTMESIGKMGGYLLSLGKWTAAKQLSDATKLPFFLIAKTLDGVYYAQFNSQINDSFSIDDVLFRGRTDRNDWQDIEPCVLLNVSRFNKLQEQ